jgi:hypothetical protein
VHDGNRTNYNKQSKGIRGCMSLNCARVHISVTIKQLSFSHYSMCKSMSGFSDRITHKVLHQIDKPAPANLCGCNKLALMFHIVASSKETEAGRSYAVY